MTESNEHLVKQIAIGLETTTRLIQSLSSDVRENTKNITTIQVEIKNLIEDVRGLSKILKDGNGVAPVLSRLAVLEEICDASLNARIAVLEELTDQNLSFEEDIEKIEKEIDELKTKIISAQERSLVKSEISQKQIEESRYKGTNKLQMWIAIFSSLIAIGAAILGVLF